MGKGETPGVERLAVQRLHPGTGRRLNHTPTTRIMIEEVVKAMGVKNVLLLNPIKQLAELEAALLEARPKNELTVIVARQPCILAAGRIKSYAENNKPT